MNPAPHALARRFIDGPITPTLLWFTLPLLGTNVLHALAMAWTAGWVGQMLGAHALPAVATSTVLVFMLMGVVIGMGSVAGVAISQSLGAGDMAAVQRITGCALAFVVGFSVAVTVLGWWLSPWLLQMLDTPQASYLFALEHLRYTCLSLPPLFVQLVMVMLLRGCGNARTPFRFTLVWIGLLLALIPLLLTGGGGAWAPMGIAGVGVANIVAASATLAALVAYVYYRRLPIALQGVQLRYLWPQAALLGLFVRRSLPVAMESVTTQGAYFLLLGLVNSYGVVTAAAYSGAAQWWHFVQAPGNALAASMTAMAAMNIGAGHWPRVEQIARRGCVIGLAVSCIAVLLIYLLGVWFSDWPLRLFIVGDEEVLAKAREINFITLWGWIALSLTMGLFAIVRANGAMLVPSLIFLVTMWLFRVPFAMGLSPWLGEAAIWWSFPFGTISSALIAWLYYRRGVWRKQPLMMTSLSH